jgi:hypothetical protein
MQMRRILLSFGVLLIAGSGLMAQSALQKQSERLSKITAVQQEAMTEYPMTFEGETNPFVSTIKAPDVVIGGTRYDLQSNSTMANRIYAYPDGTMGATWIKGEADPNFPDRGTGYNYYDGAAWGPAPTQRIDPVRSGWPSYAPYGENGEIVCAHTGGTAGLVFSWRENKGTGDWNNFYLVGPVGHEDLLWPRMVTSGEFNDVIHVIAVVPAVANDGSIYQGLDGALLYSRSFDGGETWDPKNVILDGISADEFIGFGGDEYAFAAPVGETIAFVTGGSITDGVVMKSEDNGDTWERLTFYESPDPKFDNSYVMPQHGGSDGYHTAVIDDMGRVHVASGRMLRSGDGGGAGTSFYPYSNGVLYWNETMPAMDSASVGFDILNPSLVMDPMYLLAEVQDNAAGDSIVGVINYQGGLTTMPQLVFDHNSSIMYAFYAGLTLGFNTEEANFRHIWMRFSEDYGQTWSEYTDLTGDVFHIFSECVFPSAAANVSDKVHLIYQTDNTPGLNQRYEDHGVVDNKIVHLSINTVVGINEAPANIVGVEQINPNPASTTANVIVNIDKPSVVEMSLVNMLGQVVYSSSMNLSYAGTHQLRLDVSNYDSGIYFVKIQAGNDVVAKKLMID